MPPGDDRLKTVYGSLESDPLVWRRVYAVQPVARAVAVQGRRPNRTERPERACRVLVHVHSIRAPAATLDSA